LSLLRQAGRAGDDLLQQANAVLGRVSPVGTGRRGVAAVLVRADFWFGSPTNSGRSRPSSAWTFGRPLSPIIVEGPGARRPVLQLSNVS